MALLTALLVPLERGLATLRRVPSMYAKIGAAVAAADRGDSVLIASGLYTEHVWVQPSTTLQSESGAR